MSLRTPAKIHPYPYYDRGVVRKTEKPPVRGKRVKARKQSFRRERGAEQIFKYGQIRSGVEGLATYRGSKKPSQYQTATDFYDIHQDAVKNTIRDIQDKEYSKNYPPLEDWKDRTAEALKKKSDFEKNAIRKLDQTDEALRIQNEGVNNTRYLGDMVGQAIGQFNYIAGEETRRQVARDERMFDLFQQYQNQPRQGRPQLDPQFIRETLRPVQSAYQPPYPTIAQPPIGRPRRTSTRSRSRDRGRSRDPIQEQTEPRSLTGGSDLDRGMDSLQFSGQTEEVRQSLNRATASSRKFDQLQGVAKEELRKAGGVVEHEQTIGEWDEAGRTGGRPIDAVAEGSWSNTLRKFMGVRTAEERAIDEPPEPNAERIEELMRKAQRITEAEAEHHRQEDDFRASVGAPSSKRRTSLHNQEGTLSQRLNRQASLTGIPYAELLSMTPEEREASFKEKPYSFGLPRDPPERQLTQPLPEEFRKSFMTPQQQEGLRRYNSEAVGGSLRTTYPKHHTILSYKPPEQVEAEEQLQRQISAGSIAPTEVFTDSEEEQEGAGIGVIQLSPRYKLEPEPAPEPELEVPELEVKPQLAEGFSTSSSFSPIYRPPPPPPQPEEEYKKGEVVSYTDKTGNVITATIVSVGVGLEDGFVGIKLPDGNIRDTAKDRVSKREQPQPEPEPQPKPKQTWDELMDVWEEQEAGLGDGETPKGMKLSDDEENWELFIGDGKGTPYKLSSRWTFTDVGGKIGEKVKGKEYWVMKITGENIQIVGKDKDGLKGWNNVGNTNLERGLDNGNIKIVKG